LLQCLRGPSLAPYSQLLGSRRRHPLKAFGEGCLTGQPLRLTTVTAMTECVITRVEKAAMVRTLRDEPKFSELFSAWQECFS